MTRLAAVLIATFISAVASLPAAAQSAQEVGQMRLYIQQLEERVRQLTGENERLGYELNQLRAQLGLPAPGLGQTGAITTQPLPGVPPAPLPSADQVLGGPPAPLPSADQALGAPPRDLGTVSVSPDDPLISPDGVEPGGPIDLSVLAGGAAGPGGGVYDPNAGGVYDPNAGGVYDPNAGAVYDPNAARVYDPNTGGDYGPNVEFGAPVPLGPPADPQTAALPGAPPPASALSGSPRDEYDLAYGYVLTGDYDLAEESFRNWLANFPNDPQAPDAQFWLGESQLQQGEFRDAANAFLAVYKSGQGTKGPDALLKLGTSLAALGERQAACATLAEVERKFPAASPALMSRVDAEETRAGC